MSIIPPGEKIVEKKICPISGEEFFVTDKDLEFYDTVSPIFNGKKYAIPSPTLCPDERTRRRMIWRNERGLHWRTCAATGKKILSFYAEDTPITVYTNEYWYSDNWSGYTYGMKPDFNHPFFDQVIELFYKTPAYPTAVTNGTLENSDYCNRATWIKNCYLCFNANLSESCFYSSGLTNDFRCVDCFMVINSRDCYEVCNSSNCNRCQYCFDCRDCEGCILGRNLVNCQDCFGCVNLVGKKNYFNNQPLSPQAYKEKMEDFLSSQKSTQQTIKNFWEFQKHFPVRFMEGFHNENVSGNYLLNCKNTHNSFDCTGTVDTKYCWGLKKIDADNMVLMDIDYPGLGAQYSYETETCGVNSSRILFCHDVWSNADAVVCSLGSPSSKNCFGCASLHKGSLAILNTSYSKQEYETLCGKIIDHMQSTGEWGEFFPHSSCPFGYNESVIQDFFPLSQEEAIKRGFRWIAESPQQNITSLAPLPITSYDERIVGFETAQKNIDALLDGIIICEVTQRPFKITRQELAFYIENRIPIPTKHPDVRHEERMRTRNPRKLWERNCAECNIGIITTYAPERPEKVVCEECYRKLVY